MRRCLKYVAREEIFNKLEEGYKIAHDYFSKDEYVYLDGDDRLRDEKAYYMMRDNELNFRESEFFKDRPWEIGWYVKELY